MTGGERYRSQWIEVDRGALGANLDLFRDLVGSGTELAAVVKANAYGHGLEQVAPVAAKRSEWLAVHSAEEARKIRRVGTVGRVLVMGFVPPTEMEDLDADVHLMVSTPEALEWVAEYRHRTGIDLPIHLKLNTGTNRQGVRQDEIDGLCQAATRHRATVVGVATHFANIEDTLEHEFAGVQLERFHRGVEDVTGLLGERPPFVHAACSAAALLFRSADFTVVRVGISMYGHWPSRETELSWVLEQGRDGPRLRPVLSWKAVVGQVADVPRGETVGYGRTWRALRPTRLAVIPVGYADGYARALGNRARVLVRGQPAPVVGRVCMNILMADVTDAGPVRVGDEVVLLGSQGESRVSAEELAGFAGTINYELLARISPDIPRTVVGRD